MSIHFGAQSWTTKRTATLALVVIVSVFANAALAGKYFDKDDEKAMEHLSGALMAWYEMNQLGQPRGDADMERVYSLLNRVHSECSKVPDKTLKKIDAEFAAQWRQNLQEGARQYELGLRGYYRDAKSGGNPDPSFKTQMNLGQQKMVRFHTYYNANIERIVGHLKSKGVDIFG